MRIGMLDKRIQIQSVDNSSRDDYGAPVEAWSTITGGTIWAQVQPTTGREAWLAQQVTATVTHKIVIRYLSTVTRKQRVVLGGRNFDINAVRNIDEGNEMLELLCTEAM